MEDKITESVLCARHSKEILKFVCKSCNILICRDCKITQHEGHKTEDLDDVASEYRGTLDKEKTEVEKCLTCSLHLLDRVRQTTEDLDKSVEEAKTAMNRKVDAVVEWANTHRLGMETELKKVKNLARERTELVNDYLNDMVHYLTEIRSSVTECLDSSQSNDQFVFRYVTEYSQTHFGKYPSLEELNETVSQQVHKVTITNVYPDYCQKAVERFIGFPVLAEVVTSMPPKVSVCTVTKGQCGCDPSCKVTSILPWQDGSFSVLYQTEHDSEIRSSQLTVFSPLGKILLNTRISLDDGLMARNNSNQLDLFCQSSETWHQIDLSQTSTIFADVNVTNPQFVYVRSTKETGSHVCEIKGIFSERSVSDIVHLDVSDAVKVATDKSGETFAVLRKCNKVNVYKRGDGQSAISIFDGSRYMANASLTDVCFLNMEEKERVVVAECVYSRLIILDHQNNCALYSFFPVPGGGPTAVCVDHYGSLWIGCRGGCIFTCRLDEVADTHEHEEELDDDAYETVEQNVTAPKKEPKNVSVAKAKKTISQPQRAAYETFIPVDAASSHAYTMMYPPTLPSRGLRPVKPELAKLTAKTIAGKKDGPSSQRPTETTEHCSPDKEMWKPQDCNKHSENLGTLPKT